MKTISALSFTLLLAVVSAQRARLQDLKDACGTELSRRQCLGRMRACGGALRKSAADDSASNLSIVRTCAEENGLKDMARDIIAQGGAGGIDGLSVAQDAKDAMKLCILQAKGLADDTGAVDGAALRTEVEEKITANLADNAELQTVLLDAAASCPIPSTVEDVETYKKCIGETCIQNFPQ